MKLFFIIAFLSAAGVGLEAQTNVLATTNDLAAPESAAGATNKLKITSDSGVFHFLSNMAIYRGNVSVVDPQFKLTCQWLTVQGESSQLTNIVATTNVVILTQNAKNGATEATADRAEYVFQVINNVTNKTITLTSLPGNPYPVVKNSKGTESGKVIIFNLVTEDVDFLGGHGQQAETIINRDSSINPLGKSTNAPAPAVPATNLPPATVTNTEGTNHGK
jgi:lipopolysaccharide transport protein LptA